MGTLVLAVATFSAVRSGSRTARIAERTLLAGLRPVLTPSRRDDPPDEVLFADGRTFEVQGGRAMVRHEGGVVYLAIAVRNVGAGMGVLTAYRLEAATPDEMAEDPLGPARHLRGGHLPDRTTFRPQQRDIYLPPGDRGFWQAALRDPHTRLHAVVSAAIATGGRLIVDLMYEDHEGGQAAISRFVLLARDGDWRCDVARHWSLAPRPSRGDSTDKRVTETRS